MIQKNEKNLRNQVIALAGLAQAAMLVDKLARTGSDDSDAFRILVHALLDTHPESTEKVFVDLQYLRSGMETLSHILQQNTEGDPRKNYSEILRYMLSMVHLEGKLSRNNAMLKKIATRLEHVKRQVEHFSVVPDTEPATANVLQTGLVHENILANIASLYVDTISTFRFRIQVNGNPGYLQQEPVVNKIRTLLLCGIRCAVLWRQVGGSRLKILMNRRQHATMATELLKLH